MPRWFNLSGSFAAAGTRDEKDRAVLGAGFGAGVGTVVGGARRCHGCSLLLLLLGVALLGKLASLQFRPAKQARVS